MKKITRLALACAAALTLSAPAFADVIVDTGPGVTAYGSGAGLQHDQWLASTFTLSGRETITGINGWIGGNAGTLQLAVRSAQNGLPGAVLFSTDLQASTWFTNDWVGA